MIQQIYINFSQNKQENLLNLYVPPFMKMAPNKVAIISIQQIFSYGGKKLRLED